MNESTSQLFGIPGTTAVITGGGAGIGREISLMLASAGASIAVLDRDLKGAQATAESVERSGQRAIAIECDVADHPRVASAFDEVMARFERVDILVNNAAIVRRAPALATSPETWREVMAVNVDGAFYCACEAARRMERGGAIINVASIMGLSGGGVYPNPSYQTSKGALVNLTRALAVEWASRGIRVNAVAPTWVRTELTKSLLDDPAMSEKLLALMPLRSYAETRDVAAAVLFLVSSAARMITGHTLPVDGGFLAT
jgi:NAD(P)-dependent dehydrogenase (short-subunit alcohol dehydrogenase family)